MSQQLLNSVKPKTLIIAVAILGLFITAVFYSIQFYASNQALSPVKAVFEMSKPKVDFDISQPLPKQLELDPNKVVLGHKLFHDARLSKDNTVSCASCHSLSTGGVDNRYRSVGINGGVGEVNAPTVFNSAFNFVQFWDGRAASLEEQTEGPINHPNEMGSSWKLVIAKLSQDENYVANFKKLYGTGITPNNIKDALATFERSLVTPNSRFDQFLGGNENAINAQEKNGYTLFQSYGCASCHQGINLGGNMFEKMGLMGDYFADRGHVTQADNGRYNLNQKPDSMHEFRVPSLRNVALTAPYFHDGNAKTLGEAIRIMAKYQLGRSISTEDEEDIAAFLRSLTGEYQGNPL